MNITLEQLVKVTQQLLDINAAVVKVEADLKLAKEKSRTLREETIPNAMTELGLTSLTLDSGQKLTISQEVYASIPADKLTDAFAWLNEHGFGGLIKTEVKTIYGKGERDVAYALMVELCDRGLSAQFKENIHPSTLKAFLKEQIRDGNPCPMDLFGARPVMTAKIK